MKKHSMPLRGKAEWKPKAQYVYKTGQLGSMLTPRTYHCISLCLSFPSTRRAKDIHLTLTSQLSYQSLGTPDNVVGRDCPKLHPAVRP